MEGAEGTGQGGMILRTPYPAGHQAWVQVGNVPTHRCTRAEARIQHHPTCTGLGFILAHSGERLEGNRRSFLGQVSKGGWGERGRAEGKGKNPSWQEFRAQSRSGNASLPLIAPGPDEFLEETATAMLHGSHCCACVGCLQKEGKGHRLWYIKQGKKIIF